MSATGIPSPPRAAAPAAPYRGPRAPPPPPGLQRVPRPPGAAPLARPEPRLGDHPRAHPAFQLDVVEAGAQQPGVQSDHALGREPSDDGGALGIPLERLAEGAHQGGVRLPLDVLGRIEGREAPYFSFSLIFDRRPPSWNASRASANRSAMVTGASGFDSRARPSVRSRPSG